MQFFELFGDLACVLLLLLAVFMTVRIGDFLVSFWPIVEGTTVDDEEDGWELLCTAPALLNDAFVTPASSDGGVCDWLDPSPSDASSQASSFQRRCDSPTRAD